MYSINLGNVLGDIFDMFISMLHIYLEYVRNHHYSLQVTRLGFTRVFAYEKCRLEFSGM